MLSRIIAISLSLVMLNVAVADTTKEKAPEAAPEKATIEISVGEVTLDTKPANTQCDHLSAIQADLQAESASIEIQGRALTDKEFEQLGRHHSARFHLARAKSALGCAQ